MQEGVDRRWMQSGGQERVNKGISVHSRLWWTGGISQTGSWRVRRSGVQEEADGAG